jgi:hypothetical protein
MLQGPRPGFANSRVFQTFWSRTPLQPTNQPIDQPTAQPIDQSINQSINQAIKSMYYFSINTTNILQNPECPFYYPSARQMSKYDPTNVGIYAIKLP